VTVDLRELAFTDTSLMVDLAMLSNRLRRRDRQLRLLGPKPQIMSMIEQVGLHRLPGVRIDSGQALAF
jgi:anti-anti-sigma regulatory factor